MQGFSSHHFEYLNDLATHARRQGCQVTILCNRRSPLELSGALGAGARLFGVSSNSIRKGTGRVRRGCETVLGAIANSWILLRELGRGPRQDLVLIPTAGIPHLLFLIPAVLFQRSKMAHISVQFLCSWTLDSATDHWRLTCLRTLLALLCRLHPDIAFYAQTKQTARDLQRPGGPRVECVPDIAHPVSENPGLASRQSGASVTFGSFGFARYEQGTDVLQEAIRIFLADHPEANVEFCVLWTSGGFALPDGRWVEPDTQLERTGKVKFLRSFVATNEYLELLAKADWIIMPYRKASYLRRSSRVALDAICRGVPAIYTRGTNQEELVTQYGAGLGVEDADAASLAKAILVAYTKNAEYRAQSLKQAPAAQSAFSPAAFWQAIDPRFPKPARPTKAESFAVPFEPLASPQK